MKKSTLFISFLFLALTTSAQGVNFGHFQQRQRAKAQWKANIKTRIQQTTRTAIVPLEEYSEIDEDRHYRYVYAYNTNGERASETIYMREYDGSAWSEEVLYTVGTYTYEYDTQGRVKTKSVSYAPEDNYGKFEPYRVMVAYANDGSATYTKYELNYDNNYTEVENWTYRADGSLAKHNVATYEGSETFDTWEYDAQGNVTRYNEYRLSGTLNDVSTTYENEENSSIRHYTYDKKTGKLLEYWQDGGYDDTKRYTFEYDVQGRIISIKEYNKFSEDDDYVENSPEVDVVPEEGTTRVIASADEIVWALAYEESYIYFSNETYAVNNPWKAVFNMDGPVTSITYKEYNTYEESGDLNGDGLINEFDDPANLEYESVTIFTRDESGKLVSVKEVSNEGGTTVESTLDASIDSEGQITKVKTEFSDQWTGGYDEEGNWSETIQNVLYSLDEESYTWSEGKITQMTNHVKWENIYGGKSDNGEYTDVTLYTYTDNGVTATESRQGEPGAGAEITFIEQIGNRYTLKHWNDYSATTGEAYNFDWEMDDYIICDIQTEDVSFIRPNVRKDREGFAPETPVVLSRAGRVVCVGYESPGYGEDLWYSEYDNQYHYCNIEIEEDEYSSRDDLMGLYYSISHDGDFTVASNIEGLPVYILQGSRLLKEYVYYDYADEIAPIPDTETETRAVTIPVGQAYDEISYLYDDNGLLVGVQLISVDEDGVRTGNITLEYKYDTSGISHTEMTAQGSIRLNGRILGLADGASFSVFSANGRTLADGVSQYTFAQPGVYIVAVGHESIKLVVK